MSIIVEISNNTISSRAPDFTSQKTAIQIDELAKITSLIHFLAFLQSGKEYNIVKEFLLL
jgi:hypothetical protein